MNELMVHVERAVRPVRASRRRKLAMRRELLAHLTASYEQELSRRGDEQAALRAALERFGAPAELTRELQAAVPWLERVLFASVSGTMRFEHFVGEVLPRQGEAPLRHALRMATAAAL